MDLSEEVNAQHDHAASQARVTSLDAIKAWSIFLVLTIHVIGTMTFFPRTWWSNLFTILTVTCVPLFLMVNGALLLNKPFSKRKWLHRVTSLVALTLLWKILLIVFCTVFWNEPSAPLSAKGIIEYILGGGSPYGQLGYTWFLDMYIGLQLIFPILKWLFDLSEHKHILLLLGCIGISSFASDTLTMLLSPLNTVFYTNSFTDVVSHIGSFGLFSSNGAYAAYFIVGGVLFQRYQTAMQAKPQHVALKSTIQKRRGGYHFSLCMRGNQLPGSICC